MPETKTDNERKSALARQVAMMAAQGFRVESQSDFQAVLVKGKPVNNTFLWLGLLLWPLLLIWVIQMIGGGEQRSIVSADEFGNVVSSKL